MNGVSVIDADGHILETDAELEQYFEGSYKGHKRSGVFSIFPSSTAGRAVSCAAWKKLTAPGRITGSNSSKDRKSMPPCCSPPPAFLSA